MLAKAAPPHLTLDINTQTLPRDSSPVYLGKLGSATYFIAYDVPGTGRAALFKTDGSSNGTAKIKDLGSGNATVLPNYGIFRPPYEKPVLFLSTGSKAYFLAFTALDGQEVWVTDGTASGTHEVADVFVGPNGSPLMLGLIGTDLIFVESTSATTWQIFKTDGTAAGTTALTSFPTSSYGLLNESVIANGKIYMSIDSATTCCQPDLWVTDGTTPGTHQISPGQGLYHLSPSSLTAFGNSVLLIGTDPGNGGSVLYDVDTASDTIQPLAQAQFNAAHLSSIAVMNGFALFAGAGSALWRTDGTVAGTVLVKDIGPTAPNGGLGSQDEQFLRIGNRAIFFANDGVNGTYLWSSDGTDAGTVPLIATVDQNPQPLFGTVGSHAYFGVSTGVSFGVDSLAVTDGTPAGTHVLATVGAVDGSDFGINEFAGTDTLTFIYAYVNGDPSQAPVRRLFAYAPQTNALTPLRDTTHFVPDERPQLDGGRLLFASFDPVNGLEPWISDGTVAGTHLISDVMPESLTNDSNPSAFVDFGGQLAFLADDGVHGTEIWVSDGSAGGTRQLTHVNPANGVYSPSAMSVMNGSLYFFALDSAGASHFLRVDNPDAAASVLGALTPSPPPTPGFYTPCPDQRSAVLNGNLYFAAQYGTGYELFKTDGTAAGTVRVTDMSASLSFPFAPCSPVTVGSHVFFTSTTATGQQVFATDGTSSGTVQISHIVGTLLPPGAAPAVLNGDLYFSGIDSTNSSQLWKTDGTAAGTTMTATFPSENGGLTAVVPAGVVNGKLLLEVQKGSAPAQLWVSDGTQAGSSALPSPALSSSAGVVVIGSKGYFAVQHGTSSSEPWTTDGTKAGTVLLKDTDPTQTANPLWFQDFNGIAIFEVQDANDGSQLYRSDGTSAGTNLVGPIGAAPIQGFPSTPRARLASGQNFYFTAADPNAGAELFVMSNDPPTAAADSGTVDAGSSVEISVLANDSDPDGSLDTGSVRITTSPGHGTAAADSSGNVTYTPTPGFSGEDSFAYSVSDNQGAVSAPAKVTIEVKAITVTSPAKGGGGGSIGSLDVIALLALCRLRAARRNRSGNPQQVP